VDAFSKGGNLTLGGNFTIAAGPVGRDIEGDVSVRSVAAIYTYSKTKGLFAGISVEGSCLIERKDANKKYALFTSLIIGL
jgi:lipid-binding SYLF domain-containing protein